MSQCISPFFMDGELEKHRTYKKFLLVRQEGSRQVRRNIDHYNLNVIIARHHFSLVKMRIIEN